MIEFNTKLLLSVVLFSVTPVSAPVPLPESSGEDLIRVMTYNIRYAGDERTEGLNSWKNRRKLVASVIRFHRADIVGLQEALKNQLDDLTDLLPGYRWVGVGRDDGKEGGEFSAVLFREERFDILSTSTFWLSETPKKSSRGWDAAFQRIVTWAQIKDRQTNKTFYLFNTHFDHRGEEARIQSAGLLKTMAEEIIGESPAVVTGDFNFRPQTEAYKILTGRGDYNFTDAMTVSRHGHHGSTITFNDFGRSNDEGNKIDYIFIKNAVEVIQHGIISDTFDGRFPSDHMPVMAEIVLR